MTEIRHIEGDPGPELIEVIGTGLIINHATWSDLSVAVYKRAVQEASDLGIHRVFITNHDVAQRFVDHFIVNGNHSCHGWGDVIYVVDGKIHSICHKFKNLNDIKPWLVSAIRSDDNP